MACRISVVILSSRQPPMLLRCLTAVLTQQMDPKAFEVIVVDDAHDEATRQLVEAVIAGAPQAAELRYLRPRAGAGPAAARNVGWRAARSQLVAFTDDDMVPAPTWLAEGERAMLLHPDWVAMCGRICVPLHGEPTDHARKAAGLARAEFVTANAFVRRWALREVGGFDERFGPAWSQDSDLQFRLMKEAGQVGRSSRAEVVHPVHGSPWGRSLAQQRNSYFDALLYKKHPRLYRERIRHRPPWADYAIVSLAAATLGLALADEAVLATASGLLMGAAILRRALRRLEDTSHRPAHVLEMLATSALIPFLSVYWRLRGAIHFRVLFL
jgi:glycosyltransferase involved in cell wall biosynthesis